MRIPSLAFAALIGLTNACGDGDDLGQRFERGDALLAGDGDYVPLEIEPGDRFIYQWTINYRPSCQSTATETRIALWQCIEVTSVQDPLVDSNYSHLDEVMIEAQVRFKIADIKFEGVTTSDVSQVEPLLGHSWMYRLAPELSSNPFASLSTTTFYTQRAPRPRGTGPGQMSFRQLNFFDPRPLLFPTWGGFSTEVTAAEGKNFVTDLLAWWPSETHSTEWRFGNPRAVAGESFSMSVGWRDDIDSMGGAVLRAVQYRHHGNGALSSMNEVIWPDNGSLSLLDPYVMVEQGCHVDGSIVSIISDESSDAANQWQRRCIDD